MARRVSSGGVSHGVSVAALVVVVIVFLISVTVAYSFYIASERERWAFEAKDKEGVKAYADWDKALKDTTRVRDFLDKHPTGAEVKAYLESLTLDKREINTDRLTFKRAIDFLDESIFRYNQAIEGLKTQLADAKTLADLNAKAIVTDRDEYDKLAAEKDALIVQLDQFKVAEDRRKEDAVKKITEEQTAFATEYGTAQGDHDKKKASLQNSQIPVVVSSIDSKGQKLEFLSPVPPLRGADGTVVASDWRTHIAVVNIGTDRGVFLGLIMNVYHLTEDGKQEVKGRLQVARVDAGTSYCNVLDESAKLPIVKGDTIHVPFIAIPARKRFVVAGVFSPRAPYTRDQLIGLIKLNGGVVQDKVDLFTDYLIKGETVAPAAPAGAPKAAATAEADLASGARRELQAAKEMSVRVVDYLDFISYIRE